MRTPRVFLLYRARPRGTYAAVGGVIGGLGGLVAGALIGSAVETDRWVDVPLDRLRVSLGPQRGGGFGLGLSVRF